LGGEMMERVSQHIRPAHYDTLRLDRPDLPRDRIRRSKKYRVTSKNRKFEGSNKWSRLDSTAGKLLKFSQIWVPGGMFVKENRTHKPYVDYITPVPEYQASLTNGRLSFVRLVPVIGRINVGDIMSV
jgi:hypothetical protein